MIPLLLLAFAAGAAERCSVSGTVVDSVTGKALAKVEVALEPVDRLTHQTVISATDAEGRFAMADVAPGAYRVSGKKSRYLDARGTMLRLDAGQSVRVTHRMAPAGVIAGTVRDADGEPVEGAHVVLARRRGVSVQGVVSADSDDQGNYRFGHLAPGTYYVAAQPATREPAGGEALPTSILTFYPGAAALSVASPLTLGPGRRVEGADITFLRTRGHRIRGRVRNAGGGVVVVLVNAMETSMHEFDPATATRGERGEFEFRNVPPGSYVLMAEGVATRVTVAGDVEGVEVAVGDGSTVRGRVTVEGEPGRKLAGRVFLRAGSWGNYPPHIAPDGSFSIREVPAGQYRVEVKLQGAADLYVKSVRSQDSDVRKGGLTLTGSGATELEIVMARGGAVTGVVVDEAGSPVSGGTVVVANGDEARSAVTDLFGRFTIEGMRPGECRAYAWEDVEEDAWLDPEFLKRFEGARVTVGAGESNAVQLGVSKEGQ